MEVYEKLGADPVTGSEMTNLEKAVDEARYMIRSFCEGDCDPCEIKRICNLIDDLSLNGADCCRSWLDDYKEEEKEEE